MLLYEMVCVWYCVCGGVAVWRRRVCGNEL